MNKFEEEYISANEIEHFLLHYPKPNGTPVLLYLHGGPGMFESLFAYKLDEAWGDMFTQVHWDQRGAGKTLRRNGKSGIPETIEQMLDDLHSITKHLQHKYKTDKIVILGHSWGSILGSLYALKHPENISAYIGSGQVVSIAENERIGFRNTLKSATKAKNRKHIKELEKMGDYPPDDPESFLKLLPKIRKIQEAYDNGAVSGSGLGEMLKIIRHSPSFRWSDISGFMKMARVNHPLHLQMLSFDLGGFPPRYEIPVHYILGEADNITPAPLVKDYFDKIEAPDKTITVIPQAGHNLMYERPDEFTNALRSVRETL